jgi:dihydroorotase
MQTLTIRKPFDSHVHLRRGAVLKAVTKYTAEKFSKAIVMPNTDPAIDTLDAAIAYKNEILAAPEVGDFEPLMTLYLTKNLTPQEIERAAVGAEGTKIYGVKYYPYGATTNSQWGYPDILQASDVLKEMERVGIPLLLHGEVHLNEHNEEEDPYDGEKLFVGNVLPRLLDAFPALKVSLEHMSTAVACDFIEKNGKEGRLVATVTPTHLMYDRTQAFAGGYHTLYHMKPLVKRTADKERVRELATKGLPFVSAGSDSAPHPEGKKFSSCCVFGAFNSPVALELYAQVFDEMSALDTFEQFISVNGPKFYGVEPSTETITLEKKEWQPADPIVAEDGTKLWTVLGGGKAQWQVRK